MCKALVIRHMEHGFLMQICGAESAQVLSRTLPRHTAPVAAASGTSDQDRQARGTQCAAFLAGMMSHQLSAAVSACTGLLRLCSSLNPSVGLHGFRAQVHVCAKRSLAACPALRRLSLAEQAERALSCSWLTAACSK